MTDLYCGRPPRELRNRRKTDNDQSVLRALQECGGEGTFSEITTASIDLSKRQVRDALNRLIDADLVECKPDPEDARRLRYRLDVEHGDSNDVARLKERVSIPLKAKQCPSCGALGLASERTCSGCGSDLIRFLEVFPNR